MTSNQCPHEKCSGSVTLCGKCIDVTELGNLAYGAYSSIGTQPLPIFTSHRAAITMWGGFFAEVGLTNGRGFSSIEEIASALRGMYGIGSITNGKTVCDLLSRKPNISTFWMFQVGGMKRINTQYWFKTGKDILALWNNKYKATLGTWSEAIYAAKKIIEEKEEGKLSASYIDTMGSKSFSKCDACSEKPTNAKLLKINSTTGKVTFE